MKKFIKALALSLMLVFCVSVFAGCTTTSSSKMRERYEDKGYEVQKLTKADFEDFEEDFILSNIYSDLEWAIFATREDNWNDGATIFCFEKSSTAKEMEEDLKDLAKEFDYYFYRSGKIVVIANTKSALKIAK